MAFDVAGEKRPALRRFEQGECREVGEVDTIMENQRGFETAVRKKGLAAQLWQICAVLAHRDSPWFEKAARHITIR
jgi:hypothetical protein